MHATCHAIKDLKIEFAKRMKEKEFQDFLTKKIQEAAKYCEDE